ncbi:hypothetical protein A0H76_925 [Hepatospora eriocheir]|uniref:GIT Spa2 homology (SHD) domain-containing protein n=1 Tax=Hepatospora eriocheir TaxID=1081669 RepID=A0A1X0QKZ6_9MICR|nr:hypothetical protein A0H76_925 [Hepatospora eriocheir]
MKLKDNIEDLKRYLKIEDINEIQTDNNDNQVNALEKLKRLPLISFKKLVQDVVNETKRRENGSFIQNDKMQPKFMKLSDSKFRNLIIDVLKTYNEKFIVRDEEISVISDKKEIKINKKELSRSFLNSIRTFDFYKKLIEFVKFANVGIEIEEYMTQEIKITCEKDSERFFDSLALPEVYFTNQKINKNIKEEYKKIVDEKVYKREQIQELIIRSVESIIKEIEYEKVSYVNLLISILTQSKIELDSKEENKNEKNIKEDPNLINSLILLEEIKNKNILLEERIMYYEEKLLQLKTKNNKNLLIFEMSKEIYENLKN